MSDFRLTRHLSFCFLFAGALLYPDSRETAPPFRVEASEDVSAQFPGAPRLQSFAWAQWDGKWIFIGGRTGGYHGIGQGDVDFPRSRANLKIWVIEPPVGDAPAHIYSYAVADLPASLGPVKDQWVASNLLHFQDKETLYLAGGYGQNAAGELVTYPVVSVVHLPSLVKGVMHGDASFAGRISWTESPLVQSSGGELVKLDDGSFYLVGGHIFMGTYRAFEAQNEKNTAKVYQTYLGEIRKLQIQQAGPGKLSVSLLTRYAGPEFARRDLNTAITILPGNVLGAGVYGGVFTKDQLNFTHPIYFSGKAKPAVEPAFEQKMSAYNCALLSMYDAASQTMYTTFFGGISRWTWNYSTHAFEKAPMAGDKTKEAGYLDGMPWIDHITTLVHNSGGHSEFVEPENRLPGFVGTNAAFLPAPGLQKAHENTDIVDYQQFQGKRTFVGYIYGGIRAFPKQFPYTDEAPSYSSGNVPTKASDLVLKVYVKAP